MRHVLLHAWAKTLRRCGGKRAVVQAADGATATFRELDERAEAWAATHRGGRSQGLADAALTGRAVVFAVPNGIRWLEIFLGVLKAGAVAVPVDAAEPVAAQRELAVALRAGFLWNGTALEALPEARRYRDPAVCLVKLTSGSTGRPRALTFTAPQLLADARQVTSTMGITERDLNYALIPFGHSYGLGNLSLPLLAQGIPVVCGSAALPHAVAADFAAWRPTVFPGVPALWRGMAAAEVRLDSLRRAISAGAPLAPEVAREFEARFGRRLHNFYGSSETGGIAYDASGRATLEGGVGRALRGVALQVRPGARLRVSGAAVHTHGNRRRAGQWGAWLMPDRVAVSARGEVTLLGRRGTTVKIAGRRVNLREVAERLRRLPGVRDAWVGSGGGPDPVLGAVVASDRTALELRSALLADTAVWKIPKRLHVLAQFPVTSRGKTDVAALRAMLF
ncbi:MAG TPA: class I adenylate-forming enzyme family protein [Lacunisphaera sp.]|nr:class I adenylate-forming enzyme family protein [Lacunisphaera sp.]